MNNAGSLIRIFVFWALIFSFAAYVMINKSDSESTILISTFLTFVIDYLLTRNLAITYNAYRQFYSDYEAGMKILKEKRKLTRED